MRVKITEIDFDTDGDVKMNQCLQDEYVGMIFDIDDEIDNLSDIVSDECGWCVNAVSFIELKDKVH